MNKEIYEQCYRIVLAIKWELVHCQVKVVNHKFSHKKLIVSSCWIDVNNGMNCCTLMFSGYIIERELIWCCESHKDKVIEMMVEQGVLLTNIELTTSVD